MSKDQLSWEQLLNSQENSSEPTADVSGAAGIPNEPPPKVEKKSTTKKSRSKKKAVEPELAVEETKTSYSKKDWSKLEFATSANEKVKLETETTVAQVDSQEIEVKPTEASIVVKKTEVKVSQAKITVAPDAVDGELAPSREPKVVSVSELNRHIREMLEGEFPTLWLKGEISNFKAHTSGHFYFSLKDSKAQINAVMFRGFNSQLRFRPEDGMEVLVRGKITVYEPRGNYQIFCETMEPVGAGALQKAFEQLKMKLQREGLFDESRKRPLPALPKHIAIVTSSTGAAIRDMLNVLGRRFKGAQITIIPCKVQGDQAPREIIEAIRLGNALKDVDVMIVGRGGGSIEDLWAFNDEGVARAISSARVPVISAVGHEVDFTIADFVADLRAPTPSAAAELVVKSAADLLERVRAQSRALRLAMLSNLNSAKQAALSLGKRLVDPQRRLQDASMRCDELLQRLQAAVFRGFQDRRREIELIEEKIGTPLPQIAHSREVTQGLDRRLRSGVKNLLLRKRDGLSKQMAVLDSLSPLKVLDRGYSMVVKGEEIVTDATSLAPGEIVNVRMCKGSFDAQVTKIETKR